MQTCRVCFEDKVLAEFTFRKDSGKHRTDCKACVTNRTTANFCPEQRAAYLERKSVELAEYRKGYYLRPDVKDRQKAYYSDPANRERKSKWTKGYQAQADVRDRRRVTENARRVAKSIDLMPKNGWTMLKLFYGEKCMRCNSTNNLQLDHVLALARGGQHSLNNAQILCAPCNQSKGVKPADYRKGVILESLELR